jgi:HPP family protein
MPTPWFTLRKSDAPPRPPWRQIAAVTVMSIMALIVLAFIGEITGFALLTPPLAASMALIAGCPNLPLSQPRNVIGGQLLSAIVGCAVGVVSHSIWALAIAGGLALGVMLAARAAPPPAAATAILGAVIPSGQLTFILCAGIAAAILVLIGAISAKISTTKYPIYWW